MVAHLLPHLMIPSVEGQTLLLPPAPPVRARARVKMSFHLLVDRSVKQAQSCPQVLSISSDSIWMLSCQAKIARNPAAMKVTTKMGKMRHSDLAYKMI